MDYEGLSLASLLVSFIFSPLLAPLLLICFFFPYLPNRSPTRLPPPLTITFCHACLFPRLPVGTK